MNVNGKGEWKGGVEAVVPLELESDGKNRREPRSPQTVLAGSVWAMEIKREGLPGMWARLAHGLAVCTHKDWKKSAVAQLRSGTQD